jgi:GWxTD domain-containing protein
MRTLSGFRFRPCTFVLFFVGISILVLAQSSGSQPSLSGNSYLSQRLPAKYQHWLDEDVRWIISDQDRTEFEKSGNDHERNKFIEQFWLRRDPTPGTAENEFKEEHYRRIAYSNEHFAAEVRGSLTDRGRIYILYGPPDALERQTINGVPGEIWHYDTFSVPGQFVGFEGKLPHTGNKVDLEFLDDRQCNDYRLKTHEPH